MASVQHEDGIHVTFNSEGAGCLAATWDATRTSPALTLSRMSAGDRLNLSVVDTTGSTLSLDRFFALSDASLSTRSSLLMTWLPGLDPSLFEWVEDLSVDTQLPRGVESANLQTLAPSPLSDAAVESKSDGLAPDPLTVAYHRAALTTEQWKRYSPVVFEPNALGAGIPQQRVVLAPGQGVRYGGHVVAAHQLVNGQSVTRDEGGHCLAYTVAAISEESIFVAGIELINTDKLDELCSASVEQCRQRLLAEVAVQNQMTLINHPALRLDLGGLVVEGTAPIHTTGIWRFTLPDVIPAGDLRIVSLSAVARETSVLPIQDDRMLGVALSAVNVLSGQTLAKIDLSHPDWVGLHPWEYRRGQHLRWTNGLASVPQDVHKLSGSETIELHIAAVGHYWVPNNLFIDDSEAST